MNNKVLSMIFAVQTVIFVYLNFTLDDAGTIFLILAVLNGLLALYFFSNRNTK